MLPNNIPLEFYLTLAGIFFAIGALGVLTRKNLIVVFMCIELMLNSVNLTFVAFSQYLRDPAGMIFVFFVMAVAAAEAAIGLAIVIALFRAKQTAYLDDFSILKW